MKALVSGSMVLGLGLMFLAMVQGAEPKEEVIDLGKGVKLEMILIPSGKFMMGATKEAVEAAFKGDAFFKEFIKNKGEAEVSKVIEKIVERERQHEVTISKSFCIGKYEVTQEQWYEIMESNPSRYKGKKIPVTDVSWDDCQEFIKKLNEKTKGGYRLPTEAEWEYACRAGTKTVYSFGDTITPKDANYSDSEIRKPVAVGSYKANAFGLYDMHGNVWEWCADWYGDYPKGAVTDPNGPNSEIQRVLRGGSFINYARDSRSANRTYLSPDNRITTLGFRLVRTP